MCQILRRIVVIGACSTIALVFGERPAAAQQPKTVSDVLSFLLTNTSEFISTGDFVHDQQAAAATRDTISGFLLLELATLPISSSPGGFTYRLNPTLGTVERASDSFGPFFVERSLTAGAHQISFGLTFQNANFTTIDGRSLTDGTLVATASKFRTESQPFDVDSLSLTISAKTYAFLADVGVTDRFDLGVAVPVVTLNLNGSLTDTYRGQLYRKSIGSASATGPGDVGVRAKYNVFASGGSGISVAAEARLPTGDEKNLLGAGKAAFRPLLIGSYDQGTVAAHVDLGYTLGGLSNELDYNGAVTVAGTPRLTIVGELIGRHVAKLGTLGTTTAPNPTSAGVDTIRLTQVGQGAERVAALGGFKWNLVGTWLLSAYILRPVTSTGLNAQWVPSLTLDYSFGR
jgi:hypothetical protein